MAHVFLRFIGKKHLIFPHTDGSKIFFLRELFLFLDVFYWCFGIQTAKVG